MKRTLLSSPPWRHGIAMRSGLYYTNGVSPTTSALVAGYLAVAEMILSRPVTLDRIAAAVTVAGAGSSVLRLSIYADLADTATGYPGALVLDAGTIPGDALSSSGAEITISQPLAAGRYWIGGVAQGGTPTVRTVTFSLRGGAVGSEALVNIGSSPTAYRAFGVTGALPNPFPASVSLTSTLPLVQIRAA